MARRVVPQEGSRVRQIADPVGLGAVVKTERLRRGASQEEFGALVGLTRQMVRLIEAGDPGIAVGTVLRVLADVGIRLVAIPTAPDSINDSTRQREFGQANELLRAVALAERGMEP
jgi:transcriptional regulator with XRE-family HTH domain